eukprot:SAG31_NODE_29039_length_401_cov_4.562914_1_plen_92_part_00
MTKDSVTRNERQAGVADADAPHTPGNDAAASNMEETIKRSLMNILSEPASESPSDKMQAEPATQPTPACIYDGQYIGYDDKTIIQTVHRIS